ncbi:MAG: hypothetical protein ACLRTD_10435 [Bacteroides sp.]
MRSVRAHKMPLSFRRTDTFIAMGCCVVELTGTWGLRFCRIEDGIGTNAIGGSNMVLT